MYLKKQRWKVMLTEYKGEIFNIEKEQLFNNAISYLKEHNAAQVWEQLNNRPEKIIINENTEKANYALGNDVFWIFIFGEFCAYDQIVCLLSFFT